MLVAQQIPRTLNYDFIIKFRKQSTNKKQALSGVQVYATEALQTCKIKLGYKFGNETIHKSFQQNLEIFINKKKTKPIGMLCKINNV